MPTSEIRSRGSSASNAANNFGNKSGTNYKAYRDELKLISARTQYEKLVSKNEAKAEAWRLAQLKKEEKQSEQQRLLELANARKIAQEERGSFSDIIKDWQTAWAENKREQLETAIASGASISQKLKLAGSYIASSVGGAFLQGASSLVSGISDALQSASKAVDTNVDLYSKYMTEVDTRLQGAYSGMDFSSLNDILVENTAGNPYIKYTDAVENLSKFVNAGIANNLLQRTFLATISNKIATTFDAFDASLLRIIRIQQQDTTAARLGMEAELTKLFNYYFSDTSYLSNAFDDVSSALTDLSAQLSGSTSVELEYIIQKWLGTLGESGVSDSVVTNIASAINALGTGDVDYLTSNTEMQNLLVLSANAAGLNYGDMLVNGITTEDANDLLYNLILYVRKQVSGANNVVKAKYADLFGLTMADVAAIENLNDSSLTALYDQAMTYNDTITSLSSQIAQIPNRMHYSTMITNVMDNIMSATGMNIADNASAYLTYKIADMVEGITGGIKIPTIGALGSFVSLPNSIEEYMKIGVAGYGLLSSLGSALSNWVTDSSLDASKWNIDWDKNSGYGGFTSVNELSKASSTTGFVTNTDTKGIQQSVVDEQSKEAESIRGSSDESESEVITLLRSIRDYFSEGGNKNNPLKVAIIASKNDSSTMDVGGNTSYDLTTATNKILERVLQIGAVDDPVYVQFLLSGGQTEIPNSGEEGI